MSLYPILTNGMGSDHHIHEIKTRPSHVVGTRAASGDGRVYYYAVNTGAAALARGQLMVAATPIANHLDLATDETFAGIGTKVLRAGAITPGATLISADQYGEGFLVVIDDTGEALNYKIRQNTAFTSGTADGVVTLYDELVVAWGAGTTVSFVGNVFRNPVISVTDQIDLLAGVPTFTIPAGDVTPQYGWLQTWGEASLLADEAIATVGQMLTIGTGVGGAAEEDDTATTVSQEPLVGYNIIPLVDTEYQMVMLTIRP